MSIPPLTTAPTLWTIGHSTRTNDEFLALLCAHGIARLVDVRRYPGSRRYPHFHSDALANSLTEAGLTYRHMPNLGGRRTARPDSPNKGWKNVGFRGYADYMHTEEFQEGLETLMADATRSRTVIMCAEAVPWRCHRSLIADRLLTRGWDVRHIMGSNQVQQHHLTAFAVLQDDRLLVSGAGGRERSTTPLLILRAFIALPPRSLQTGGNVVSLPRRSGAAAPPDIRTVRGGG